MRLTDDQERAAAAAGSVAVTAGAGTGKTRMLAHRFLHHMAADGLSPLEIVAATFTDKAAGELRSRIRQTIEAEFSDGEAAAEVEAAQISTIHGLAARICRDFYDLAGIPADFSILDEARSPVWLDEKLEEAFALLDPDAVARLGYSWVKQSLKQLLADPFAADEAFNRTVEDWKAAIDAVSRPALAEFLNTDAWLHAVETVNSMRGEDGDKLEAARKEAAEAIAAIQNGRGVCEALSILEVLKTGQGRADGWPAGGKAAMSACLTALKETAKQYAPTAGLECGDAELKVAAMLESLRPIYLRVRDFLRAEKNRERVLDFTDLEHYALEILKHDGVLGHYADRWKAFLIDEFQDTNPVQGELIRRLTRNAKLTVVGDEKQSIYGFRRADVEVFSRFCETIRKSGGDGVSLDRTFRAHSSLIAELNSVFEPVLGELHQPLEAERHASAVRCVTFRAVEKCDAVKRELQFVEAHDIARRIKEMLDPGLPIHDGRGGSRPVEPRDIAILSRTWGPLDIYADALAAAGVPAVHSGGGNLLETREFKDTYALLSFLADQNDDVALVAVLRSPFFACSDKVLFRFASSLPKDTPWWAVIRNEPGELSDAAEDLSRLLSMRARRSAAELLSEADRLTGYRAIIGNLPHGSRRLADWSGALALARSIEKDACADVFAAVRRLRQYIEAEVELPRPPLDAGQAVTLMTIHRSKGLEWPVVFVADLARDRPAGNDHLQVDAATGIAFRFPGEGGETVEPAIYKLIRKRSRDREEAEARRLMYVAMTRAGEQVHLTATADKGPFVELLRPGLEAAGIEMETIPFSAGSARPAQPPPPTARDIPLSSYPDPLKVAVRALPVTALSVYAECPLKFRFMFADGHPGIGEGPALAASVGTLTHKALELDLSKVDELGPYAPPGTSEAQMQEALRLAGSYRSLPQFSEVRLTTNAREKRFRIEMNGIRLTGSVDAVGPDFVLDHKTDTEVDPVHHRFQLWVYARALRKNRAYIAYLRHGVLHEFSAADLAETEVAAEEMFRRIGENDCGPKASSATCGRCNYSPICESRFMD
jgi:ATP-dependent helicase/nuclease subunit A